MPLLRGQDAFQITEDHNQSKGKMNHTAVLEVYEDPEKLLKCLAPGKLKRASFAIKKQKDHVKINVTAKDLTALRATLNSITQLLAIYKQMQGVK